MLTLWIGLTFVFTAGNLADAQHPNARTHDRAAMVMDFDQAETVHHFYLYADGGAIDIGVKDATDTGNRDAIRAHLPHIASMFGAGDFNAPMLVHDTSDVPGASALARLKTEVSYTYVGTPAGGRVNIVTTNKAAVAAVHQFLTYQIREHHTGDDTMVRIRK